MTDQLTHIAIILDRSGSMDSVCEATIEGVNALVCEQAAEPGAATLTLVQFDSEEPYETVFAYVPIAQVPELTHATYQPRGMTPLLDAVGTGIKDLERWLAGRDETERPGRIVFAIVTDGHENASSRFSLEQIKELIARKEAEGWQFVFVGADLRGFQEARRAGWRPESSIRIRKTKEGIRRGMKSLGDGIKDVRSGRKAAFGFEPGDYQFPDDRSDSGPAVGPAYARNGDCHYPYDLIDGHIVIDAGGERLLIDTGLPVSMADSRRIDMAGRVFNVPENYMGITPAGIGQFVQTRVDGLVGADLLREFTVEIDPLAREVVLRQGALTMPGTDLALDEAMGIPILTVSVDGQSVRAFFDSGAKLSYLAPEIARRFPQAGPARDFYPGLGAFTTDTYRAVVNIEGEEVQLLVGILPELLQMTLMMANTNGILGSALLDHFRMGFNFAEHRMVLDSIGR